MLLINITATRLKFNKFIFSFKKRSGPPTSNKKSQPLKPKRTIRDARFKIIQKNRKTIRDAREKIAENARKSIKDARELLSSKKPTTKMPKLMRKPKVPRSRAAHLTLDEDLLMEHDDIELDELNNFNIKPNTLRRTISNEMFRTPPRMPKLPTFSIENPEIDPFDCYIVPTRRPTVPLPPLPARRPSSKIMTAHMDSYPMEPRKSILRSVGRSDEHDDRFENDRYVVKESRYAHDESAGIFARTEGPSKGGYSVIVGNLDAAVTQSEVRELFEDIGALKSCKMIRPGTAEVIYENYGDAERSVDTYHNRALDNRPMKCYLNTSKATLFYR
jgi:RNA recognition motif. (a.k.a. RRM, RBD, or RNP domain)